MPPIQERGKLGIQIGDLTAETARQLNLDPASKGAVVVAVEPGSAGQEAGINPGDVILRIGSVETASAAEVRDAALGLKAGDSVPIIIRRAGSRILLRASIR